jgi:hypothetical protein
MEEPKWERVNQTAIRLSVPGGWIYKHDVYTTDSWAVFVPKPKEECK